MKTNIIKLIVIGFVFLGITSCEDMLEENPKTFISPDNFFQSYGDFEAAINGAYRLTHNLTGTTVLTKEVFADWNDMPESSQHTMEMWRNAPGIEFWVIRNSWSIPYQIISNANQILVALEGSSLTDAEKISISAEAKFLRANAYFDLVQFFGDVPLREVPIQGVDDTQIERSSQADVYGLIIQDLKDAESGLPPSSSLEGKVNSYVAKALLARVYLTTAGNPMNITANYALAKSKALEVIAGPYALQDNIADVFKNTSYTSESIWEIIYLAGVYNNGRHNLTAPTGNSSSQLMPSPDFENSFPIGDNRKDWGIKDGYTATSGNVVIARTYFNKFIDVAQLDLGLPPSSTLNGYTFPLIRLAEMYLIAAEAENEVNGPAGAYQYINEIRQRARMDKNDATHVPDLAGLTQDEFREAVWMERKWELHAEDHAWFDLKRTNTFNKVQEARGAELSVPIGSYNQTWLIPDYEILNNDIEQNPSYGGN